MRRPRSTARWEPAFSARENLPDRFPEARRKAYYLISIHEQLPRQVRKELAELAQVARRDPQRFDCATWLHKAREMPKQQFKDEVEKFLAGQAEPSELIYFKPYRSQIPVIEQALETAARMLGSDKSSGFCLEMICADFLAGANLISCKASAPLDLSRLGSAKRPRLGKEAEHVDYRR